jgi:hypothetical protein
MTTTALVVLSLPSCCARKAATADVRSTSTMRTVKATHVRLRSFEASRLPVAVRH